MDNPTLKKALHMASVGALKEYLASGVHKVRFYKADGTLREMKVTLEGAIINEALGESQEEDQVLNEEQLMESYSKPNISVFDVENHCWKSFKLTGLFEVDHEHPRSIINRYLTHVAPATRPESELTSDSVGGESDA